MYIIVLTNLGKSTLTGVVSEILTYVLSNGDQSMQSISIGKTSH